MLSVKNLLRRFINRKTWEAAATPDRDAAARAAAQARVAAHDTAARIARETWVADAGKGCGYWAATASAHTAINCYPTYQYDNDSDQEVPSDQTMLRFNPANGLPMQGGSLFDITGQIYGFSENQMTFGTEAS